jgi:hypothetical protein
MRNPLAIAKRSARSVLESTNAGYRFLLRRSEASTSRRGDHQRLGITRC